IFWARMSRATWNATKATGATFTNIYTVCNQDASPTCPCGGLYDNKAYNRMRAAYVGGTATVTVTEGSRSFGDLSSTGALSTKAVIALEPNKPSAAKASVTSEANDWATRGPLLWEELHRWARTADLGNVSKWLRLFERRIDCGECRNHWRAWVT